MEQVERKSDAVVQNKSALIGEKLVKDFGFFTKVPKLANYQPKLEVF